MAAVAIKPNIPVSDENAEGKLPPGLVRTALTIDTIGGVRQVAAAAFSILSLFGQVASACFFAAAVPVGLLLTGPLTAALAVKYAIPDSLEQFTEAKERVEEVEYNLKRPLEAQERREVTFELGEAKRVLKIAKLGMVNQSLLLTMGLGQAATGVVAMLAAPPVLFNITPVLTGAAAHVAVIATSVALSAIYFLRGTVMVYRSKQNLDVINELAMGLRAKGNIREAMAYMKGIEALGPDYLKRRLDVSCLGEMTANGCKTPGEEKEYLRRVDKAIYSQALKHKVAMCIGFAMIIGAVLGIIAANLATGGIPLLLVSLGSALFFLAVEVPFLVYDSPKFFAKYRDFFYARQKVVEFEDAPEVVRVIERLPVAVAPDPIPAPENPPVLVPVTSWCATAGRVASAAFAVGIAGAALYMATQ